MLTYKVVDPINIRISWTKVGVPNSVTYLNQTPIFWVVCGKVWLQKRISKLHVLKTREPFEGE